MKIADLVSKIENITNKSYLESDYYYIIYNNYHYNSPIIVFPNDRIHDDLMIYFHNKLQGSIPTKQSDINDSYLYLISQINELN